MQDEEFVAVLEEISYVATVREAFHRGIYAEERCNGRRHVDIGGEG